MNIIYYFLPMLSCFWVIEYCSSLPRFCSWHLICYRKWIFPLIWILCSNSILGGRDEWRDVPGGLCLAKRVRGHRLLGTCRYCFTFAALDVSGLRESENALELEALNIYRLNVPHPNAGDPKCSGFHTLMHNEMPWRCGPILNTKYMYIS